MILLEIAEYKRFEVQNRIHDIDLTNAVPTRDFAAALRRPSGDVPNIIAEVKRASPSKGIIREDFNPVEIAKTYESAGAAAMSVLTDEKFFQGHLSYLTECRSATSLPTIRKDFIIDSFQIREAREAGADAILLIVAILSEQQLMSFQEEAQKLGMSVLVEVHNEAELETALSAGARIVGINNRDLNTFTVDLETTFRLIPLIPEDKIIVSESGIRTYDDLRKLSDTGVHAALIGETFMRADDPGRKLLELMGR